MDISVLKSLALSKSNVFLVRNQKKNPKDAKISLSPAYAYSGFTVNCFV
jgi:hypothetical protein